MSKQPFNREYRRAKERTLQHQMYLLTREVNKLLLTIFEPIFGLLDKLFKK